MTTNTRNHIKSTFKHAMIYSASGIIGKAVGFVMLPVYAHYLRGEGYGIIGMIDVVLAVITLLIGYGIQGAMSRFYFEKSEQNERNALISTAIILMFVIVLVVSSPVILFSDQVAWLAFGNINMGFYITLAVLTFIATMSSKSAETYILIKQESWFFSILALIKLCMALFFNIYFIVYLRLGVLGYLYSGLIVAVLFSLFLHFYALSNVGLKFVKHDALSILKFSLPLLPGYVAMFIRNNTDRILLRTFLGLSQLGAFEMLFKFATLIGLFIVEPFSKIMGVKQFEIADEPDGPENLARIFTYFLSILLFFGLLLSLQIPIILKLLTPKEFWLNGNIAVLAVLSRIILACYYYVYFGLLYAKKTHKISLIQGATSVVSFILCLWLIKSLGILGAVIASCLTAIFQCYLAYRLALPYYYIPFEYNKILIIFCFSGALFLILNTITVSEKNNLIHILKFPIKDALIFLHLDNIKDGKLFSIIIDNIPLIIEGIIKFFFSFFFLIGLVFANIIPKSLIVTTIRTKSLHPLFSAIR